MNLLDNRITTSLGLNSPSTDGPVTLNSFVSKFGSSSQFEPNFLTNNIRARNEFTVSIVFHPNHSRVRWMLSQALNTADVNPDFQFFVRKMDLPGFKLDATMTGIKGMGEKTLNGDYPNVALTNDTFTMDILSTDYSLAHHIFYYWMKEVSSPFWEYILNAKAPDKGFTAGVARAWNKVSSAVTSAFTGKEDKSGENDEEFTGSNSLEDGSLATCQPYTVADIYVRYFTGSGGEELHTLVLENCYPFQVSNYPVDNDKMFHESVKVIMHCANAYIMTPFTRSSFKKKLTSSIAGQILEQNIGKYVRRVYGNVSNKFGTSITEGIKGISSKLDVIGNSNNPFG